MSFVSTIIIPERVHPNFLYVCLQGLIKNSLHKHKIIIVHGDPNKASADDWIVNPDMDRYHFRYRKYRNMGEFLDGNTELLRENNITTVDVTEKATELFAKYKRGEVFPGKTDVQAGVDIAFKVNKGIELAETEWIIPNWDDDFYPSPGWDDCLLYIADRYKRNRAIFISTYVQPLNVGGDLNNMNATTTNIWSDFDHIACNRLTLLTDKNYVTEEEWREFCLRWTKWRMYAEPCGLRDRLHYVPMLYRKEYLEELGPYNYQGNSYELEFDARAGEHRFLKIASQSSFIGHKLHVPM